MYNLNESAQTLDPAQAIEQDPGVFEFTSPGGEKFRVVCREGHSIASIRSLTYGNSPWQIKKIAELRTEQRTSAS